MFPCLFVHLLVYLSTGICWQYFLSYHHQSIQVWCQCVCTMVINQHPANIHVKYLFFFFFASLFFRTMLGIFHRPEYHTFVPVKSPIFEGLGDFNRFDTVYGWNTAPFEISVISVWFADLFVSSKVQKINAQLKEKKNKLAPQIKAAVNFTGELWFDSPGGIFDMW